MVAKIAILIPTMGRAERLEKIGKNIKLTTKSSYNLFFIAEARDRETISKCEQLGLNCIVNLGGSYVSAINLAFNSTKEPFLLLGADDISFTQEWDTLMLAEMENPKIGVVGHLDDWAISKTKKHGSHLLIRRSYIDKFSGVEDEASVVYSSAYKHFHCDIETEQTAMKRNAFAHSNAVIEHNHWVNGKATKDKTYLDALPLLDKDNETFIQRRHNFEQYLVDELREGNIYKVNRGKLSIVMASYNAPQAIKETIESLYANTYHNFELIIVDDNSSNSNTLDYIKSLVKPSLKRVFLKKQGFTTNAWNVGVKEATGDYIAVLNNDITLSKNWDVYLINELDKKGAMIANPFQTDVAEPLPYGKSERSGNINIRGVCYAFKKTDRDYLFPLPSQLVMWFSDWWLALKVDEAKAKSVFVEKAVVFNMGSKSSGDLQEEKGLLWWIIRGDALQFEKMTGIDVSHWENIVQNKIKNTNENKVVIGNCRNVIPKTSGYCDGRSYHKGEMINLPESVINSIGFNNFEIAE